MFLPCKESLYLVPVGSKEPYIHLDVDRTQGKMSATVHRTRVIAVTLLFIVGAAATAIFTVNNSDTLYAQVPEGPYFVGEGTTQTEIGPSRTQLTYSSSGTMNGNIEVTTTAEIITGLGGSNFVLGLGEGVIQTIDKSETADYSFFEVGGITQEGNREIYGIAAYSTNSTGELTFLNNTLGLFKRVEDPNSGNFVSTEWELKNGNFVSTDWRLE